MKSARNRFHGYGFHKRSGMKFNAISNALLTTVYTSNSITIKGVPPASAITVAGGTYSINGGAFTAAPGTISPGDTLRARGTSSGSDLTLVTVTVTIGALVLLFKVTTGDHVPNAFAFADVNPALLSTIYTSNQVIPNGYTIPTAISISGAGATYSINGGAFTSSSGTLTPGDGVVVKNTSSGSITTAVNSTLTVGGISDTYTVTTGTNIPNAFTFTDINPAELSTIYISNIITVTGATIPTTISISGAGAQYRINGGAFTASAGTVSPGDSVEVRNTSSASDVTAVNSVLTIGGVSDTYSLTTGDSVPTAFTFTDITGATISTIYTSNAIVVAGINIGSPISIVSSDGALYRINGGSFVSSAGLVHVGDTVDIRVTSSGSVSTAVSGTLTIGGVSDTYTVTTAGGSGTPIGLLLALTTTGGGPPPGTASLDFSVVSNSMYTSLVV